MQPGDKVVLMRDGKIVEDTICHVLLTETETLLSFNFRWTPTSARPPEWVKESQVFTTLAQLISHLEQEFKERQEIKNTSKVTIPDGDYDDDDDLPSRKKGTPKTH